MWKVEKEETFSFFPAPRLSDVKQKNTGILETKESTTFS